MDTNATDINNATETNTNNATDSNAVGDDTPIANRRPRRTIQLPQRFRDIVPESLPSLPPAGYQPSVPSDFPSSSAPLPSPLASAASGPNTSLTSRILQVLRTPRNIFGLFRQYRADKLPSHDPEELVGFRDLQDGPTSCDQSLQNLDSIFYPYPNENSFRLGEWYWNHGIQKSRESFSELLTIVGDSKFRPEDVQHKQWNKIDKKLAGNVGDGGLD
jgi:hypothetical protein